LITLRFKSERELIEAVQALEACIGKSQGGYQGISKKRDGDYFSGRPPLPKKGKSGVFEQYRKKESLILPPHQQSSGRVMVRQSHSRANSSTGTGDCKVVDYPFFVKCEQKHPRDYSVSLMRCFVCRGEGHRWRNCQYLGQRCHYYGGKGHYERDCPKRNTGQVQSYRQPSQSHHQSITVNRPVIFSQSGANSSGGRLRAQNDQTPGRVFHLT